MRTPTRSLALACALAAACAHAPPAERARCDGGAPGAPAVDVEAYLATLPPAPLVAGFDVDDTVLFSTPAFLYAEGRLVPDPARLPAGATPQERLEARRALFLRLVGREAAGLDAHDAGQWRQFWEDVNTEGDGYSPPKEAALRIARRHVERGDEVVFITGRANTGREALSARLAGLLGVSRARVEFTANGSKQPAMRGARVQIYYGDADGDMADAKAVGATGVRIIRSAYSSNKGKTQAGCAGEASVIRDSQR